MFVALFMCRSVVKRVLHPNVTDREFNFKTHLYGVGARVSAVG